MNDVKGLLIIFLCLLLIIMTTPIYVKYIISLNEITSTLLSHSQMRWNVE